MADDIPDRLEACSGFDWDESNASKLWTRHGVTQGECEQIFFQEPFLVASDVRHSNLEERWAGLGRTADGRRLVVVFTIRGDRIRPISARDMNRKERRRYAEADKDR